MSGPGLALCPLDVRRPEAELHRVPGTAGLDERGSPVERAEAERDDGARRPGPRLLDRVQVFVVLRRDEVTCG